MGLTCLTISKRINRLLLLACSLAAISKEGLASALLCCQSGRFNGLTTAHVRNVKWFPQLVKYPVAVVPCRRCWRYVPHIAARIKMPTSFSGALFGSPARLLWALHRCLMGIVVSLGQFNYDVLIKMNKVNSTLRLEFFLEAMIGQKGRRFSLDNGGKVKICTYCL